jgi:hypothetical protein
MAELLHPLTADGRHVVRWPPVADLRAVAPQFVDHPGDARVARVPRGGEPEPAEHGPRLRLPLQVDLPGRVAGEHPADEVPLTWRPRRPRPVAEQLAGGLVGLEHVPAPALDQGGARLQAPHQPGDTRGDLLGWRRGGGLGAVHAVWRGVVGAVREGQQVPPLGPRHPQRRRERVEHLLGRPRLAALLEERVVGDRHAGELRDLFAAQPRGPSPGAGRQPDVGGREPLAARPQQFAERTRISGGGHVSSLVMAVVVMTRSGCRRRSFLGLAA